MKSTGLTWNRSRNFVTSPAPAKLFRLLVAPAAQHCFSEGTVSDLKFHSDLDIRDVRLSLMNAMSGALDIVMFAVFKVSMTLMALMSGIKLLL